MYKLVFLVVDKLAAPEKLEASYPRPKSKIAVVEPVIFMVMTNDLPLFLCLRCKNTKNLQVKGPE